MNRQAIADLLHTRFRKQANKRQNILGELLCKLAVERSDPFNYLTYPVVGGLLGHAASGGSNRQALSGAGAGLGAVLGSDLAINMVGENSGVTGILAKSLGTAAGGVGGYGLIRALLGKEEKKKKQEEHLFLQPNMSSLTQMRLPASFDDRALIASMQPQP